LSNLFDTDNFPTDVPDSLVVGDNWLWKREDIVSDYPTGSYALSYSLRLLASAATEIRLDNNNSIVTETATSYLIQVPSTTTADYAKGDYEYQEYITNGSSQRLVLNTGYVNVKPNLDADSTDPRSHARIVVDALEAMLENRASIDQSSMSIAGRSLSRMTPEEIRDWYEYYRFKVSQEIKKERIKKGKATSSIIKARF
jgi:hypothetical protein